HHLPPREISSRRAAVAVRTARRLAAPIVRHEHPAPATPCSSSSPPPPARPGRGPRPSPRVPNPVARRRTNRVILPGVRWFSVVVALVASSTLLGVSFPLIRLVM